MYIQYVHVYIHVISRCKVLDCLAIVDFLRQKLQEEQTLVVLVSEQLQTYVYGGGQQAGHGTFMITTVSLSLSPSSPPSLLPTEIPLCPGGHAEVRHP